MDKSWSYRYRGKFALTKMKKNATVKIFKTKAHTAQLTGTQIDHPPKKRIVTKIAKITMFPYSPKKNNANVNELYSTLYPATNSA